MRYPIGFSTLGCPKWPWPKVLEQAAAMGYSSLEIRGIEGDMDLPKRPEFAARRLTDVRKDLAARDLVITDLGASARLHERDPRVREQQLDEARRFIDLAHNLGVPWIRVFPNEYLKDEPHEVTLARIGDTLAELGRFAKGSGVGVLVESHGDITGVEGPERDHAARRNGRPALGSSGIRTTRSSKARKRRPTHGPRSAKWVYHTHIKDSVADGKDRRYVLLGTGTVGVKAIVQALVAGGYKGRYNFEWEKVWHPGHRRARSGVPAVRTADDGVALGGGRQAVVIDKALVAAVRRELKAAADPSRAPAMQAYMKSAMPYYGVGMPGQQVIWKKLFRTARHPRRAFVARDDAGDLARREVPRGALLARSRCRSA
jgi:sugar phosphate isomerase/epimerase